MKQILYFVILYALGIIGCRENAEGPTPGIPPVTKMYIGKYVEVDSIDAGIYTSAKPEGKLHVIDSAWLGFYGKLVRIYENRELLDYYSNLYEDTTYNRRKDLMLGPDYVADYWESVNLTCDKDYDARHPAGTSLNDIVRLSYRSPYAYIKNGYQNDKLPFQRLDKLISKMTREDLLLIENSNYQTRLIFNSHPDEQKPMVFTLTWKSEKKTVKTTFTNVQQ